MQIWQKANECLGFFFESQIHGKAMPKDIRLGKLNCSSDSKHLPKNGGKSQNRISKRFVFVALPKKKCNHRPQNFRGVWIPQWAAGYAMSYVTGILIEAMDLV